MTDFIKINKTKFSIPQNQISWNDLIIKGVNYAKADHSLFWRRPFVEWELIIKKDIKKMIEMGINVARIFLTHTEFMSKKYQKTAEINLRLILDLFQEAGIYLIPTLFVWSPPAKLPLKQWRTYVDHIMLILNDKPGILAIDLNNEPDHSVYDDWVNETYLSSPRWIAADKDFNNIYYWLIAVYERVKFWDKNHLIMVGEFGWWFHDARCQSFSTCIGDILNFHWYQVDWELEPRIREIRTAFPDKIILISEIGLPSAGVYGHPPEAVARYLEGWWNLCKIYDCNMLVWTWCDFPDNTLVGANDAECSYGLVDINDNLKPAGLKFKDLK